MALVGTTVLYRPSGGSFAGWQQDLSPAVGLGRFIRETIAVELDISPTFLDGEYLAFSFVPGVVWAPSPRYYAAARFLVPVDPDVAFTLFPGVGIAHGFASGISIFAELNGLYTVSPGAGDLGLGLSLGALYPF